MGRQIDNAAQAHAEHQAEQQRREAFHAPFKATRTDQNRSGPSAGFSSDRDGARPSRGNPGEDCNK